MNFVVKQLILHYVVRKLIVMYCYMTHVMSSFLRFITLIFTTNLTDSF